MNTLIPVDGSPASMRAVRHVLRQYARHGLQGRVTLLSVQPALYRHITRQLPRAELAAYRESRARDSLAPAIKLLRESGVPYRALVAEGPIGQAVLDEAARVGADQIVLGIRRKPAWQRALLPSISRDVLDGATIPVAVLSDGSPSRLSRFALPAGIGIGLTALMLAD
ncbi:MAG: universal stress protein [Burkholderiaceae bacterium]